MTLEAWLLAATTAIAVVAAIVAVVAVCSVRRLAVQLAAQSAVEGRGFEADFVGTSTTGSEADFVDASTTEMPVVLEPRLVQGRVIVPPTQSQVVRTALGRPGVRLSVLAHGLAHALRAENRDRIAALMRREYRHRRRERLSAGRQAIRMARPTSAPTTDRLHAHLMEPKPTSLADRMIGS